MDRFRYAILAAYTLALSLSKVSRSLSRETGVFSSSISLYYNLRCLIRLMEQLLTATDFVIRKATRLDFVKISKLNTLTKRPQRTDAQFREYFVAEMATEIVGCAALRCRRNSGYLYGLTVHPRWRRHGIGHSLTKNRLETIRDKRLKTAFVFAMFWNVKFFKQHGFRLTDRKRASQLQWLHKDFEEDWCRRSALLFLSIDTLRTDS
jgi:N-acetylglutamate synthase-like GNAT family acetyltransferase